MEVHAHTHAHGKKTWRSYFWEFLMLFLAVFSGFLAENLREKIVENNREKEFAETLKEDLENDITDLNKGILNWQGFIDHIDTVRMEIEKEPASRDALLLYRNAALLLTNTTFNYHDRTVIQLKNAGNFRLIRNRNISDSLIEYDAAIVNGMKDIEASYTVTYFQNREVLQEQLFDSKFYPLRYDPEQLKSAAIKEPEVIAIRENKEDVLFQYYNSLFALSNQTRIRIRALKILLEKAENLIVLIKKEYHLQ
jgi:hypothetical protein